MFHIRIFFLALALFCLTIPVRAETWKMLVGDAEDSGPGFAAQVFKNYVENHTFGQTRLEIVYGEEPEEVFEKVKSGEAAFGLADLAGILRYENRLVFPALPGLFEKDGEIVAATSGEAGLILQQYAEKAGFHLLGWTWQPAANLNSRQRLAKLADLRGLELVAPPLLAKYNPFAEYGATLVSRAAGREEREQQLRNADGEITADLPRKVKEMPAEFSFSNTLNGCYEFQPLVANAKIFSEFTENQKKIMEAAAEDARTQLLQFREEAAGAALGMDEINALADGLPDDETWKTAARTNLWPKMLGNAATGELDEYLGAVGK